MSGPGDKLKARIDQFGLLDTVLYALARLLQRSPLRWRLVKFYLVAQAVPSGPLLSPRRGRNIVVRDVPADEYADREHPCPRPAAVISERYEHGATCLGAYKEQQFCGCLWYVEERYQEDVVRCVYELPGGGSAWDFDVLVVESQRLSPAFPRLWDAYFERLRARQVCWSYSRISAFNPESLQSHKRLGAMTVASVTFMCIGDWQLSFSTLKPYIHGSRSADRQPHFQLPKPSVSCDGE